MGFSAQHRPADGESPGLKGNNLSSPMKGQGGRKSMYPASNFSPKKSMKAKPKISPSKKKEADKQESGLVSPTSIQMQNTFIIKNADESFDAYYAQMRKRKLGQVSHGANQFDNSTNMMPGSPNKVGESGNSHFGIIWGIKPAARDGHATEISDYGHMFVFGGDRHHMPFNDLYMMSLNE
jgi:hypothetical protein